MDGRNNVAHIYGDIGCIVDSTTELQNLRLFDEASFSFKTACNVFPVNLDINECKDSPCHQNATCTDRPGYYNCSCNEGFNGNVFDCRGIISI